MPSLTLKTVFSLVVKVLPQSNVKWGSTITDWLLVDLTLLTIHKLIILYDTLGIKFISLTKIRIFVATAGKDDSLTRLVCQKSYLMG